MISCTKLETHLKDFHLRRYGILDAPRKQAHLGKCLQQFSHAATWRSLQPWYKRAWPGCALTGQQDVASYRWCWFIRMQGAGGSGSLRFGSRFWRKASEMGSAQQAWNLSVEVRTDSCVKLWMRCLSCDEDPWMSEVPAMWDECQRRESTELSQGRNHMCCKGQPCETGLLQPVRAQIMPSYALGTVRWVVGFNVCSIAFWSCLVFPSTSPFLSFGIRMFTLCYCTIDVFWFYKSMQFAALSLPSVSEVALDFWTTSGLLRLWELSKLGWMHLF